MKVYEMIQTLAKYDADAEVHFHADFEYSVDAEAKFDRDNPDDVQDVTIDAEFDDDLELKEVREKYYGGVIFRLRY